MTQRRPLGRVVDGKSLWIDAYSKIWHFVAQV